MSKTGREPIEALFEHARRDGFAPAEMDRLWQRVVTAGPGVGDGGGELPRGKPSMARGASSGAALKLGALLLLAGGVGVAGYEAKKARTETGERPQAAIKAVPGVNSAPVGGAAGGPPVISWEDLPRTPEAPGVAMHAQRPRLEPAGQPLPVAQADVPRLLPAATVPTAEAANAEPRETAPTEGALLLRARQELASDPASALALTDEDARRFPAGPLSPEREVLAVEALARLRRLPEARVRLTTFRVRYPQSPHLARLDALVGR